MLLKVEKKVQDSISDQPIEDDKYENVDEAEVIQWQQQYNNARDRLKRQIKPPQRYAYSNLFSFALSLVDSLETEEPFIYHEAITGNNSAQWTIVMSEEIESLSKNQT